MRGPFARGQDWKDYLLAREHFDASTITAGAFFVARFTGREETCLVTVIIEEMGRGNFSFLILIVGLLQLIVILRKH